MKRVCFGVQLPQDVSFDIMSDFALEAEKMNYDSVWYADHLYFKQGDRILECWTTLSALAAITKRIRIGSLVTCNIFRYPSLLAKMATTVDMISEGRLELGIGAGWHQEECEAYGIPFQDPKTRQARFRESLEMLEKMWTKEKVSFEGQYYSLKEANCWPSPAQKPHPPLTIGGHGESLTIKSAARYADRYNPCPWTCTPKIAQKYLSILKKKCLDTSRDYDEIDKIWFGWIVVSEDSEKLKKYRKKVSTMHKGKSVLDGSIIGTVKECRDRIQQYLRTGLNYFIGYFGTDKDSMRLFSDQVIPHIQK